MAWYSSGGSHQSNGSVQTMTLDPEDSYVGKISLIGGEPNAAKSSIPVVTTQNSTAASPWSLPGRVLGSALNETWKALAPYVPKPVSSRATSKPALEALNEGLWERTTGQSEEEYDADLELQLQMATINQSLNPLLCHWEKDEEPITAEAVGRRGKLSTGKLLKMWRDRYPEEKTGSKLTWDDSALITDPSGRSQTQKEFKKRGPQERHEFAAKTREEIKYSKAISKAPAFTKAHEMHYVPHEDKTMRELGFNLMADLEEQGMSCLSSQQAIDAYKAERARFDSKGFVTVSEIGAQELVQTGSSRVADEAHAKSMFPQHWHQALVGMAASGRKVVYSSDEAMECHLGASRGDLEWYNEEDQEAESLACETLQKLGAWPTVDKWMRAGSKKPHKSKKWTSQGRKVSRPGKKVRHSTTSRSTKSASSTSDGRTAHKTQADRTTVSSAPSSEASAPTQPSQFSIEKRLDESLISGIRSLNPEDGKQQLVRAYREAMAKTAEDFTKRGGVSVLTTAPVDTSIDIQKSSRARGAIRGAREARKVEMSSISSANTTLGGSVDTMASLASQPTTTSS